MQASWTENPARLLRYRVTNLINGESLEYAGYTITRVNGAGYTVTTPAGRSVKFGYLTGDYDRAQIARRQREVVDYIERDMQQEGAA